MKYGAFTSTLLTFDNESVSRLPSADNKIISVANKGTDTNEKQNNKKRFRFKFILNQKLKINFKNNKKPHNGSLQYFILILL